tara:strand:+ start:117 stop:293 length:177 start_codon:yes stop_codon:yes gene_type:complete
VERRRDNEICLIIFIPYYFGVLLDPKIITSARDGNMLTFALVLVSKIKKSFFGFFLRL